MQEVQARLLWAQQTAIREKRTMYVQIQGNTITIDSKKITLPSSISCAPCNVHFTPLGNVSQAMHIQCSSDKTDKQIRIQLGTGRMYVK